MGYQTESWQMKLLSLIGMDGIAWSLRRLHCPVDANALVLDVGSGGNPYPRANVLLDAYEDTFERYHLKLVKDRPLVFGMAENMPFKDKAFDFVIASHVLEHVSDPAKFLNEMMRVGKSGYIETPDALIERLIPFRFHRLEVTDHQGQLIIYKKPSWRPHSEMVDLFERKMKNRRFIQLMKSHPAPFYTRYYWTEKIDFRVANPEVDAAWVHPPVKEQDYSGRKVTIRRHITNFVRTLFSQNARNRSLDITPLLRCTKCYSETLTRHSEHLECIKCGSRFSLKNGSPMMSEQVSA